MDYTILETNEYKLRLLSHNWCGPVVIYISNEGFGEAGEKIKSELDSIMNYPFTLCELIVHDWDNYLTPWKADGNMKGRTFKGNAGELLRFLDGKVIPVIKAQLPDSKIYISGYSLAGLFSLWSMYESSIFDGAACCSGSVWYPGWLEYATQHKVKKECRIYLSLGNKEKNTKHPLMKTVEERMERQYELLKQDDCAKELKIEWNEGGHFDNTQKRVVSGIKWLLGGEE